MSQGAIEAVCQIHERAQQFPLGLPDGRNAIAFDPAPVIFEVRYRPQVAVVLVLQLGPQSLDAGFKDVAIGGTRDMPLEIFRASQQVWFLVTA